MAGDHTGLNAADMSAGSRFPQTVAAWHDEILRQVQNTIGFVMRLNSSAPPGPRRRMPLLRGHEIEAAIALENSPSTVKRDWLVAPPGCTVS